jgi:small nuclear ribonucleoprotein (snRNP)-like protein
MEGLMLDEYLDQKVVIDLRSEYVCLGTLKKIDEHFLELRNADLHDLRDTETSRENYVAAAVATGIKRNRKRLVLMRAEVVAISALADAKAAVAGLNKSEAAELEELLRRWLNRAQSR